MVGETRAGADQARRDRVGARVEHAPSGFVVEAFAIDEQKRAALLWRQMPEEARGKSIVFCFSVLAEQPIEARLARFRLTEGIGVIAQLMQPQLVDLGERPAIERGPALIAMLLGKHSEKRPAKESLTRFFFADQDIGETLEPRQHGDQAMPDGLLMNFCLHA